MKWSEMNWINECMNEWMCQWVHEPMDGWMTEWMKANNEDSKLIVVDKYFMCPLITDQNDACPKKHIWHPSFAWYEPGDLPAMSFRKADAMRACQQEMADRKKKKRKKLLGHVSLCTLVLSLISFTAWVQKIWNDWW